jgi:hypothetical protein
MTFGSSTPLHIRFAHCAALRDIFSVFILNLRLNDGIYGAELSYHNYF